MFVKAKIIFIILCLLICGSTFSHNISDSIIQQLDTIMLKEVEVSTKNITRKGMDYKINDVQKTFLAETSDIFGMLKRTPGVIVSADQSISVIGSGTPIIYIDGRRIYSTTELLGIPTSNIRSIEVIRQPGVEYPSGTNAVIKLTTIKRLSQYASLSIRNALDYNKYLSDMPSATINIALKKWSFLASVSYRYGHGHTSYNKELCLYSDDGMRTPTLNTCMENENKAHIYSPMLNIGFNPNNKSSFIATYSGRFVNRNPNSITYNKLNGGNIEEIQTFPKNNHTNHTASAGYTYNPNKKNKLNLFLTYQRQELINDRDILIPSEDITTFFNRSNNVNLVSTNAEYSHSFKRSTLAVGAEYGYINSKSRTLQNSGVQNIQQIDYNYSGYATYSQRISKVSLNIGCRLSGLNTNISTSNLTHSHFSVYPSLRSRYDISNGYTIGASLSRNTFWPTISQLNPNYSYTDAYHISHGNLDLKPVTHNEIEVDCNINDVTVSLTFDNYKGAIVQNQMLTDENVIIEYPINSRWKNMYELQCDYNVEISKLEISTFAYLLYEVTKMPEWSKYIRNLCGGISCDLNWRLTKKLSLYSSWFYQTPTTMGLRKLGYQLDASVGATLKLLKNKMVLTLEANDLFNRSILPTSYTYTYSTFKERVYNNYHGRGLTFSIRYNFNSVNSKFIFPKMSTSTTSRSVIE